MNIDAFFKLSYGLYVVASRNAEGRINGHINNTSFQITADPPQFAVSVNKENLTGDYIRESGVFSLNILHDKVEKEFVQLFGFKSGRDTDKFADVEWEIGHTGAPILKQFSAAVIEFELVKQVEIDTHILYIGRAVSAQVLAPEAVPITYERYRNEIKGRAPKTAPTFFSPKLKEKLEQEMKDKLNAKQ